MKRNIVILGSTGSIGRSSLNVIAANPGLFSVVGLSANRNVELLKQQVQMFRPEVVAMADRQSAIQLGRELKREILAGEEGVIEVASHGASDTVISAIVGSAGLKPTMAALRAGKRICLANKETLVMAGDLFMQEAQKYRAEVLPVDSEHSAVFQCLEGRDMGSVAKIILTASGGPFVGRKREDMEGITPADALNHPSWSMGAKITVDSATLMNKGLEVIEAHYLFGLAPESIEVMVHPQSIVHSMVEFRDLSCIAQLSVPDMRAAIAYALSYPERLGGVIPPLDLPSMGTLTFLRPDIESFPCLGYAYDALRAGGTMPAVINAANEVAVEHFLNEKVRFNDIPAIIKNTMDSHENRAADGLQTIMEAHEWATGKARELAALAAA